MLHLFQKSWAEVSTVWLDVETTGVIPGKDAAVQVAIVRFDGGMPTARIVSLVDPGLIIPEEATAIHGITNEMLRDAPTIQQVFARDEVKALLKDAQPGAYSASFDRAFLPLQTWGQDWHWNWLDPLTFVRAVDRWIRGSGRHKLEAACERRGIVVEKAHDAASDAEATGRLFYRIVPELCASSEVPRPNGDTIGHLLRWQRVQEANQWWDVTSWLARQPPRAEEVSNG